jgi:hypothetical protein
MKLLLMCLVLPVLAGCTSTERSMRIFEHASVSLAADKWQGYRPIAGKNTVLEDSQWVTSVPMLVDSISGYRLELELSQDLLVEGNKIDVPSWNSHAFLHVLNAPAYRNVTDVSGTVLVTAVEPRGIRLELNLHAPSTGWAVSGAGFYRYASHTCVGKSDWACDFYSK